ncbi:MAG: glycosyltransferase [Coriobacteriales bacterium]|jgi:glycosyltransferase involved in cell wall biosynthesis|nr:glycosyltransferase [Coriobacteriales bacterium]
MSTPSKSSLLITFSVPCYNVATYLNKCITSILEGAVGYEGRFEVLLVDDGSVVDDTAECVDNWARQYPGIIKAIHQQNGGHGEAVNTGLRNARGAYFKVVDADDWLDVDALKKAMALLAHLVDDAEPVDLVVTNYVYEKAFEFKKQPIRYTGVLPEGQVIGWDAVSSFKPYQNILMHSVTYRTEVLRSAGLELPRHTFYVDNIFVYVPLPSVKTLYYLNVDLYRYFIGRDGQSVNEKTMAKRIDQQLRITRIMIDAFVLDRDVAELPLRAYMTNYLTMMMVVSSVFLLLSGRADALELRSSLWEYLKERNPGVYPQMRNGILGRGVNLRGRVGRLITLACYRLARMIFKFN